VFASGAWTAQHHIRACGGQNTSPAAPGGGLRGAFFASNNEVRPSPIGAKSLPAALFRPGVPRPGQKQAKLACCAEWANWMNRPRGPARPVKPLQTSVPRHHRATVQRSGPVIRAARHPGGQNPTQQAATFLRLALFIDRPLGRARRGVAAGLRQGDQPGKGGPVRPTVSDVAFAAQSSSGRNCAGSFQTTPTVQPGRCGALLRLWAINLQARSSITIRILFGRSRENTGEGGGSLWVS